MSFSAKSPSPDSDDFEPSGEINVTPFVDVMLVLLIVFMVTAPMLAQGIKVDLPRASGIAPLPQAKGPLIVSLKEDGGVYVGADPVTADALESRLKMEASANPKVTAHIRAAAEVPYRRVLDVMAALGRAGVTQIAFISRSGTEAQGRSAAPAP